MLPGVSPRWSASRQGLLLKHSHNTWLRRCKIDHWLRANKLSLYYNKTNFVILTFRKHNLASFKVIINNHNIFSEDNLKYLGVLLDNKLSWKPYVQKVKTQLSRACGILSKYKHYTTLPVLEVVYHSLIHPYLNYSILNWGRASNATIQPLTKLQKKAIKIINPINSGSLEEHFQHLNIVCLPKLYSFSVGKFITNCFQTILMNILFHSAQSIIIPQDLQLLKTCLYLELTLPQENVLLNS